MLDDRKKLYKKATLRQFRWTVFFLLFTFVSSASILGHKNTQPDNSNFDKEKWLTSSDYRYEIAKSEKFPSLGNLTKKQIIKLLGEPNCNSKNELTYCFDIPKEKKCDCDGSFMTINLSKKMPAKFRVTMFW
jgi:hypothetical protein